jgi:hypothetical protein
MCSPVSPNLFESAESAATEKEMRESDGYDDRDRSVLGPRSPRLAEPAEAPPGSSKPTHSEEQKEPQEKEK